MRQIIYASKMSTQESIPGFTDVKLIGKGGYGTVFRGVRKGQIKAIKKLPYIDEGIRTPIELDIMSRLNHPNIVRIDEIIIGIDALYYTMDIAVADLGHFIYKNPKLSLKTRVRIIYELASAIHFIHQNGIFHCDIKPGNVLIYKDGKVKLTDFGIAQYSDTYSWLCQTDIYAPPEVLINFYKYELPYGELEDIEVDKRAADIWALAVTIVYILTGRRLFGDRPDQFIPEFEKNPQEYLRIMKVPESFKSLLVGMLKIHPEDRIKSVNEIFYSQPLKDNRYSKPISGMIILDVPIETLNCDRYIPSLISWVKDIYLEIVGRIESFYLAVDLIYRSYNAIIPDPKKAENEVYILGLACIVLASQLVDGPDALTSKIVSEMTGDTYKVDDIADMIITIIETLKGILYRQNFYNYALSIQMLAPTYFRLTDCSFYRNTNFKQYMIEAEMAETPEEQEDREDKDDTINEFNFYLSKSKS
jgi:serine/threonine protein kinase